VGKCRRCLECAFGLIGPYAPEIYEAFLVISIRTYTENCVSGPVHNNNEAMISPEAIVLKKSSGVSCGEVLQLLTVQKKPTDEIAASYREVRKLLIVQKKSMDQVNTLVQIVPALSL